jgi:Glucodextranase, domain B
MSLCIQNGEPKETRKRHRWGLILFTLALLLTAGCELANAVTILRETPSPVLPSATSRAVAGSQPVSPSPAQSTPLRSTGTGTILPKPMPQKTLTTPVAVPIIPAVPPLTLQVRSPLDESIVNTPTLTVMGTTTPNTVVSVNGQLATVDASGNFQLTLSLDEGPNVIEVVASDVNGNEMSAILSVIYQP